MRTQRVQWYGGETVSVAIGQGQVSATPLQLARLAAIVANGGRLVRPHLVRSVGGVPIPIEPAPDLGLKPETLAVLRAGMKAVVAEGTGWRARLEGLSIARQDRVGPGRGQGPPGEEPHPDRDRAPRLVRGLRSRRRAADRPRGDGRARGQRRRSGGAAGPGDPGPLLRARYVATRRRGRWWPRCAP